MNEHTTDCPLCLGEGHFVRNVDGDTDRCGACKNGLVNIDLIDRIMTKHGVEFENYSKIWEGTCKDDASFSGDWCRTDDEQRRPVAETISRILSAYEELI
jgi:hypothetical protein